VARRICFLSRHHPPLLVDLTAIENVPPDRQHKPQFVANMSRELRTCSRDVRTWPRW
jgi:hypothetical protein